MARPLAIIIRFVVTLALIAGAVVFYKFLVATGPEPKQRPAPRHLPVVETMELDAVDYRVKLPSQGIVEPRTETQLTAEVAGKVSRIADAFLNGAAFEEGEVLIELDDRDYRTALKRAEAALAQAKAALVQAEAETAKAREDWERLNLEGEPSDLALRLPQLREAEANVEAAEADVAEAELNVERCRIVAPYDGRVMQKQVDVGQYVGPATALGQVYSTEMFEVRLPLRNDQLSFLEFEPGQGTEKTPVLLTGEQGPEFQWPAWLERTEASVDPRTRQLFVIAAVDNTDESLPPLPSGTFVEAQIAGEELSGVFTIPRSAVRAGRQVVKITDENRVKLMELDIVYHGDPDYLVAKPSENLEPGDEISLTPMPFATDGDEVQIQGEKPPGRGPLAGPSNPEPERSGPPPGEKPSPDET